MGRFDRVAIGIRSDNAEGVSGCSFVTAAQEKVARHRSCELISVPLDF